MRTSLRASRNRILAVVASFLLSGAALAAVSMPARAVVGPITITAITPQAETTGTAFSIPVVANGGDGTVPLTFTIKGTPKLPAAAGITISQPAAITDPTTVDITGTFTAPYDGTVTITAADATPADEGTATFALTAANAVTLTNPGPQSSTFAAAITPLQVAATDSGGAALTYSATKLPTGLAIDPATGLISGTPTKLGRYATTVTATDATGSAAGGPVQKTAAFTWTIGNKVTVNAPAAKTFITGTPISPFGVSATDTPARAGAKFTFASADLPPGLKITTTGGVSGTPTGNHAVYVSHITATDDTGAKGTAAITFTVRNKVTVTQPPAQKIYVGTPYTLKLSAKDSDATQTTFAWKVVATAPLPAGLKLNAATGVISGTPPGYATLTSEISAADASGGLGSVGITFTAAQPIQIYGPGKVTTVVGQGVSAGIAYRTYVPGEHVVSLTASGLPVGVTFLPSLATPKAAGLFYGWPTRAGKFKVKVTARGSKGTVGYTTFQLVVLGSVTKNAPVGHISLLLGGKCLQDPGSRTAGGTRIVIGSCVTSGTTENWAIGSNGTIRINGRCLDIAGAGSSYANQPLQLWTCNGAAREFFLQGRKGELVNPASGLCVTDPGASKKNGTVVRTGACHVRSNEQWTLPAQPVLASANGKCMDDKFSSMANGNVIDMYSCNNTISQAFTFMPDGTLRLFVSKCVTVRSGKIVLWSCTKGGGGQRWTVVPTGGLGSELTMNGVCLAVPSLTAADTTQLVTRACGATDPRVTWHIW